MKLPKILEDCLGWCDWHGVDPDKASVDQMIEWGSDVIGDIQWDKDEYINDETGFSEEDWEELKVFVENLERIQKENSSAVVKIAVNNIKEE